MPNIGPVALKLVVNAVDWVNGLDGALKGFERFAGNVKTKLSSIPVLGGAIANLGLPLSMAGGAAWIDKSAKDLVELSNQAKRYGLNMREAATFELLAGDNAEGMNKALEHMSHGIGAVRAGGGDDFTKALRGLGLSGGDLAGKSTAEAYSLISQRIAGMGNAFDRANATREIFGRGAQNLSNVINGGAAGFADAAAKVDRYGLAVSDADAAQMRLSMRTLSESKLAMKGTGRQAASFFAPVIGLGADMLNTTMGSLSDLGHGNIGGFLNKGYNPATFWAMIKKAAPTQKEIWEAEQKEKAQGGSSEALQEGGLITEGAVRAIEKQIAALTQGTAAAHVYGAQLQLVEAGISESKAADMVKPIRELAEQQERLSEVLGSSARGLDIFAEAERKTKAISDLVGTGKLGKETGADAITKIQKDLGKAKGLEQVAILEETKTPLEKLNDQLEHLRHTYDGVAGSAEIVTARTKQLKDAFVQTLGIRDPAKQIQDTFEQLDKATGPNGISRQQALAAKGKSAQDLINQSGMGEPQLPQFMTLGSADFANMQARMEAQAAGGSWQDRLLAAIEYQNRLMERDAEVGRQVEEVQRRQKPIEIKQADVRD